MLVGISKAVPAQGGCLGSPAVETRRLQEGQNRRRPEAGGHTPSHVARWNRLHLVKQGGDGLESTISKNSARAEAMSLSGRWRRRDRPRLCDASSRQARFQHWSASVLQRHHAEGSAPTAERTVNPAGASTESLTSNPELENSLGYKQTSSRPKLRSLPPTADIRAPMAAFCLITSD